MGFAGKSSRLDLDVRHPGLRRNDGAVVAGAAQMSWNQGLEAKDQDHDNFADQNQHNERKSMITVVWEKLKNKER